MIPGVLNAVPGIGDSGEAATKRPLASNSKKVLSKPVEPLNKQPTPKSTTKSLDFRSTQRNLNVNVQRLPVTPKSVTKKTPVFRSGPIRNPGKIETENVARLPTTPKTITKKVPDFRSIHNKNFSRCENVAENAQRIHQRHSQLQNLQKHDQNLLPAHTSNVLGSRDTNIPRLQKTETEIRTPKKPTLSKPFHFQNQNLESNINFGTACQFGSSSGTTPLKNSAFNRRKSYNPSESLNKPLNYNPHVGKLKSLDCSKKKSLLAGKQNLNESVSIKSATISTEKRKSIFGMQKNLEKEKLLVKRKALRNNEMDKPRHI